MMTKKTNKQKGENWGQEELLRVGRTKKQNKKETVASPGATCRAFIGLGAAFSGRGALWGKWPL